MEHDEPVVDADGTLDGFLGVHDGRMVAPKHSSDGAERVVAILSQEPHQNVSRDDVLLESRGTENVVGANLCTSTKSGNQFGQFIRVQFDADVERMELRVGGLQDAKPRELGVVFPELFDGPVEVHLVATFGALHWRGFYLLIVDKCR